jgi:hypothetical protein
MAARADEIERQVLGQDRELTGALRVTTAFVVMEHLLPQPLAEFARACPGIEVEVVENAFLVDLASRHRMSTKAGRDARPMPPSGCRGRRPNTWWGARSA